MPKNWGSVNLAVNFTCVEWFETSQPASQPSITSSRGVRAARRRRLLVRAIWGQANGLPGAVAAWDSVFSQLSALERISHACWIGIGSQVWGEAPGTSAVVDAAGMLMR